jgi:hypothetical protein
VKNRTIVLCSLATSLVLATGAVACSGSDSTDPKKSDTSPTTPSSSGGTSGTPSSSGTMTSGGTSGGTSGTSGGTSGTSGTSGGGADAGDVDAGNCVAMGYAGNDKHVGAYCDKDVSCPFQTDPFLICTYGHDPTNTHLFCTAPCSKDSECGTGAYCVHDTAGSGCVPTQCGGMPGM